MVVLLVGPCYGSLLPQGISYTHAEYREAKRVGIPVIAIRIPSEADLDDEELERLRVFAAEIGSTTTYDSLAPNESLERISPRVLAAVTSARDRGDIGNRFSVFQEYERYFKPLLLQSGALFSHEGLFVGREQELEQIQSFIDGSEPLLFLKASGGSGKSRLLLEAAKAASQRAGTPRLYFTDPSALWSASDINSLPVTSPAIVVFDDGHRRSDLDRIVTACRQHNEAIRYLVSCRPSAIPIVAPLVSLLLGAGRSVELELPRLPKQEAAVLAGHYLGDSLRYLAERLVAVADCNPLVVCVGARCIAEKRVLPEVRERTPEAFRRVVLERLLDDPVLTSESTAANRCILEVVSTIGPIIPEQDQLVRQLAARPVASCATIAGRPVRWDWTRSPAHRRAVSDHRREPAPGGAAVSPLRLAVTRCRVVRGGGVMRCAGRRGRPRGAADGLAPPAPAAPDRRRAGRRPQAVPAR